MRRTGKKLLALCLTAILIIGLLPTTALAVGLGQGNANKPAEIRSGYIPMDFVGGRAITDAYVRGDSETVNNLSPHKTRATLPSSYDSRNYGYITSVKNQNPYGTCWTFGTMAPIEAYMIKHGIINKDTGAAATASPGPLAPPRQPPPPAWTFPNTIWPGSTTPMLTISWAC